MENKLSRATDAENPGSSGAPTENDFTSFPEGPETDMCALPTQTDSKDWIRDYLQRQRAWSQRTFGPGKRTIGLTKHIEKELEEIRRDSTNLEEWIDVLILAFDGAWRCQPGMGADQILDMLETKQTKNMGRTWPAPTSEDEPVEHDRSKEGA